MEDDGTTGAGPDGVYCFRDVDQETPAGPTVNVSPARAESDVRIKLQYSLRMFRLVEMQPEELSRRILEQTRCSLETSDSGVQINTNQATFSSMFTNSGGQDSQTTFRYLGGGSSLEDSKARIKLLNEYSTLISEGPPERRLLNTSKEEIDKQLNIRRWTFGVKNPQKMIKTIVLLGETGTGKSTFINVMINYILGVEWSDKFCYEIVKVGGTDQSESQTSEVTVYEIFGYEDIRVPFSLRIIDTPGYADTKGGKIDKKLIENLCYLFQCEGIQQLDAVCLVVRASQNRLTDMQRYIFDAILSLFGKDIKKNIIPVFTFSGRGKPAALAAINKFNFPWCRDTSNNLIYFKFDNPPEDEDDSDTSPKESEAAWNKRKQSLQAFFKYLNNLETRSLVMTYKVLFERDELECCVKSIQDQIVKAEHKQNEIRQTQAALEEHKKEIEENKNFTYEVEESFTAKVKSDRYATSCKKCKVTCHHPCNSWYMLHIWCSVSRWWNCSQCSKECTLKDHVREKEMYVPSVRKVTKTYEQLKEKYEDSSRGFESGQKMQKKLKEELSEIESKKQRLILESYNHIIRLNEIALRPESLSILPNLNFLIDKLCETNESDKAKKLKDICKQSMNVHSIEEGVQSRFIKFIASLYS